MRCRRFYYGLKGFTDIEFFLFIDLYIYALIILKIKVPVMVKCR